MAGQGTVVVAERVTVEFAGPGAGVDELSWGMWEIWHAMVAQRSALPIGGRTALPAGSTVAGVAEELRYLMGRFPSMRTRLRFDAAGHPTQQLFDSGRIGLEVYEAAGGAPEELAAEVEEQYRATPFDYAEQWPVRMAVVCDGGVPTHLVSVMHHLVADAAGGAIMLREVARRASGPVTGLQQLEQAAWQRSPAGRLQNERALRHWERILRAVPARRFPPSAAPETPPHWTGELLSPALPIALRVIAERTGSDSRSVLLALYGVALRRLGGSGPVVVRPVVNNRFRAALGDVVCMVAQAGIAVLDVDGGTVDEAVGRAARAALAGYKYAYFHPEDLNALVARVSAERGEQVDVQCFFNDRSAHRPEPVAEAELPRRLRAAQAMGEFRWVRRAELSMNVLQVQFEDRPGGLLVEVLTDTRHFSAADAEALLRGIEAVAVEAALDPATTVRGVR
ncbi:condensation domain-containing protein [Streptomyces sp. TLI_171]|uniref:condensation domain-containing protein n=1 Tax=Streptomyces sp. TLI_171 TaxID=1938859 RepID=UPI000C1A5C2F|nr:condensation domain-containing protein [Streptomyces sp. TLI_171]RKE23364.1 condensation domain-containing protein [Streptomyces sp. TLI_171]